MLESDVNLFSKEDLQGRTSSPLQVVNLAEARLVIEDGAGYDASRCNSSWSGRRQVEEHDARFICVEAARAGC